MENKKKINRESALIRPDETRAALATEYTGFIPAEPQSETQSDNYEDLTPVHRQ